MLRYDFLKDFASFRKMSTFYGLSKTYLYDIRYRKTVIANEYLDQMKQSLSERLKDLSNTKHSIVIEARNTIYEIIELYRQKYNPKPTANTQIDENLKRDYFSHITTIEQAYFLGLMFADGWITIQHSKVRSFYRIGLALKVEDKNIVENFGEAIGLSEDNINIKSSFDKRTGKKYKMAYLYFGAGSTTIKSGMANDLINLGMAYSMNRDTGRRYKVPILPIFCDNKGYKERNLMLAFLLGYYDGDGTLKANKYPIIYSSNKEFLEAISRNFDLGAVSEAKREILDSETNEIKKKFLYSLSLSQELFKEMMKLKLDSMDRKSIAAENIILNKPIMTKCRKWLGDILSKDFLIKILDTHAPSKIAKLIGINHMTLVKFIDHVYRIPRRDKAYYIKLTYERRRQPKNSEINRFYEVISQVLLEIRKNNPFM